MPLDIQPISDEHASVFDPNEYVCLRPSRFGAICVHEQAVTQIVNAAQDLSSPCSGANFADTLSTDTPSSHSPFPFSSSFSFDSLPLFKFEDSVKNYDETHGEKCYVLDWEQSVALTEHAQNECASDPNCSMNAMFCALDVFNGGVDDDEETAVKKPALVFCGADAVDVNYMLSSQVIPLGLLRR